MNLSTLPKHLRKLQVSRFEYEDSTLRLYFPKNTFYYTLLNYGKICNLPHEFAPGKPFRVDCYPTGDFIVLQFSYTSCDNVL